MIISDENQTSDIEIFPPELSKALDGLNNEKRQKILLNLYKGLKMSFSQLNEKTGIVDSLLSSHLRKLKDSMLIEHFYDHIVGQDEYSFYKITEYGKRIMNNLFDIFYVIQYERIIDMHIRITEKVTAVAPKSHLSGILGDIDDSQDLSDTAEEIKQVINERLKSG